MSLSIMPDGYQKELAVFGKKSGREINKPEECKLSPIALDAGGVGFDEARLILNCKKICTANVEDFEFLDKAPLKRYDGDTYHKMYICEITEALVRE